MREVEEPFGAGQKGSSAMPHKRNPILSERITGLARVLRGYAQVGLENVALWHERDISHSGAERVILPDATIGLDYMQHLATRLAEGMTVHRADAREPGADPRRAVQPAGADRSGRGGMTRDDAYRLVQESAQRAWDEGISFRELIGKAAPELDLDAVFDYDAYLEHVPEVIARLDELSWLEVDGCLGAVLLDADPQAARRSGTTRDRARQDAVLQHHVKLLPIEMWRPDAQHRPVPPALEPDQGDIPRTGGPGGALAPVRTCQGQQHSHQQRARAGKRPPCM